MKRFKMKKSAMFGLCAAAALCLGIGVGTINYQSAFAEETQAQTFVMEEGASIRKKADGVDQGGIRFTATISQAHYDEYTQGATKVESGTFILPYAYYTSYGAINKENCFGENNIYYYTDEAGSDQNKDESRTQHKILNAQGTPRRLAGENAGYEINGSVVDMLDENLNVPYIGVSYLKVTGAGEAISYYFAEIDAAKNVRSAAQVAQNCLLKETADAADKAVAQAYMDKFIKNNPNHEVSYKETFKVVDETGVRLDESLTQTKTAAFTKYDETVTSSVPAGYRKVTGFDYDGSENKNTDTAALKLNGSTTLCTVVEKVKDNVIFNAQSIADGKVTATVVGDLNQNDSYEGWAWAEGEKSIRREGNLELSSKFELKEPYKLPYTNTFSATVRSSRDITLQLMMHCIEFDNSDYTNLNQVVVSVQVKKGAQKVYFTADRYVKQVNTIFFSHPAGDSSTAPTVLEIGSFAYEKAEVPFNRAEGAVGDFEAYEGGEHFGIGSDGFVLDCPVGNISVSNEWASDGDYSVKVIPTGDGWSHIWSNTAITVSEYNTIEFDIYVDRAVSGYLFYVYDSNGYHEGKVDLKKGVNHVTYTFNQSFSTYRGIELRAAHALTGVYYIDRIVLSKV